MRPFFFLGKDKIVPWVAVVFFRNFNLQPNGNHPYGDLAKSGYKPHIFFTTN
jgi:hypothetical protein